MKNIYKLQTNSWTVERAVFLVAGMMIFITVLLGIFVSEKWLYFTAFMSGMMIFFSLTGLCPMAIALQKVFKLKSLKD